MHLNGLKRLGKGAGEVGNRSRDHSDYSNTETNTETSPGDVRIFAVSQTLVKDHLQTLE